MTPMKRVGLTTLATTVLGAAILAQGRHEPASTLLGFPPAGARQHRTAEETFSRAISTDAMSEIHRRVTARPHVAGSPGSMEVADTVRRALADAGLETEVHE